MDTRSKNFLLAFAFALLTIGIAIVGYQLTAHSSSLKLLNRILILAGGDFPGGIVQFFIFLAFYWCAFEINHFSKTISFERKAYGLVEGLENLPRRGDEHTVISPEDIRNLKLEVIDLHEQHGQEYLLTDLIKKACTKFRADKSISDVMSLVSEQTRINYARAESSQSVIRFLLWSMPSIGFIGTIMGIAGALSFAAEADSAEGLEKITNALYLAFDTTLLALALSIIAMWLFNRLQEKEELFHHKMEEYVIENLVNRIVLR
ncbi:MAG: MotA/TolQ/ExbB proton channel family protein [Phaeodactylibacter sp.]|nr:MotA/TolQ/ExbB proton channel family protein [Phaeodactylibacter sp.]